MDFQKRINSPTPLYTDGDPTRSPQSFLGYHWANHNDGPRRVLPFGPHMRLRPGCNLHIPADYNGPRVSRRLLMANSSCSASAPGFSSPFFPNRGLLLIRGDSWCRVSSGGTDAELTKLERFRLPSSIHENPASDRDGRTFGRCASRFGSSDLSVLVGPALLTGALVSSSKGG